MQATKSRAIGSASQFFFNAQVPTKPTHGTAKNEKDKNSNRHINLKVREVIDQEEQTGSNSNRYVANAVRRGKEQIFYEVELNCKHNQSYNEARPIQLFIIFESIPDFV